ncbi:MAG: nitric oxide reductase transcriptional regulator NorR [Methylosarcina sp.]
MKISETFDLIDIEEAFHQSVLSLTANLSMKDRYTEFLNIFARVAGNHAVALLRYQDGVLIPVATFGLSPRVMTQSYQPEKYPRLTAIIHSRPPIRFQDGDLRPDPFDSMLLTGSEGKTFIQSCVGCSLYNENTLFGVLLASAPEPDAFDHIDDRIFQVFASIATVSLRYETYISTLEKQTRHSELVASELVNEVLRRSSQVLGESAVMQELSREIDIVARSELTVLLLGETGVGKEVAARIIHSRSQRADQPLVYVNCAALPETLAESELFGHVRGAFSGATSHRIGKFELADGGTLFLDEVGELPLAIQAKMLRAVQFGEIQRLGSDKSLRANVRIIAATNRRLQEEIKEGRFRADLYHRLSVYPLTVPPLRERVEDIVFLARYFLDQARVRLGLETVRMSPVTINELKAYSWPGNVRELEHVILRAVLRASSSQGKAVLLEPADLDIATEARSHSAFIPMSAQRNGDISLAQAVDDFQRERILATLAECSQNWAETARCLGIDRGNLHRLAKRLGIK